MKNYHIKSHIHAEIQSLCVDQIKALILNHQLQFVFRNQSAIKSLIDQSIEIHLPQRAQLSRSIFLMIRKLRFLIDYLNQQDKLSLRLCFIGFTDPMHQSYITIDRNHGKHIILDYDSLYLIGKLDPALSRRISDELDGDKPN